MSKHSKPKTPQEIKKAGELPLKPLAFFIEQKQGNQYVRLDNWLCKIDTIGKFFGLFNNICPAFSQPPQGKTHEEWRQFIIENEGNNAVINQCNESSPNFILMRSPTKENNPQIPYIASKPQDGAKNQVHFFLDDTADSDVHNVPFNSEFNKGVLVQMILAFVGGQPEFDFVNAIIFSKCIRLDGARCFESYRVRFLTSDWQHNDSVEAYLKNFKASKSCIQAIGQDRKTKRPPNPTHGQGQYNPQRPYNPSQGQYQSQRPYNPSQGQCQSQRPYNPNQGQYQSQRPHNPNQGQYRAEQRQQGFDPGSQKWGRSN